MPTQFKDKDGNVIDLAGVDESIINVVGLIVEGQASAIRASIAEQVGEAVGKAVSEQVKPIADKVEAFGKTDPPKAGDDANKSDVQKAIEAALKPVLDTATELKNERDGERKARTSRGLAEQFVGKHRPNLKGKDVLIERIARAGVTSEAEAKAISDAWDREMTSVLGEEGFKKLSADPEGEGAKKTPEGADAEKAEAKANLLKDIRGKDAA